MNTTRLRLSGAFNLEKGAISNRIMPIIVVLAVILAVAALVLPAVIYIGTQKLFPSFRPLEDWLDDPQT